MKTIVRKMPDMVLDRSFGQLDGKYETCYAGNAMETFMRSVEMSRDDDCLNLEDDIILCEGFADEVARVVGKYPRKVISFFTLKDRPLGESVERGRTFCMNQCVYMPRWMNRMLIDYYPRWLCTRRGMENPTGYDYMMGDLLGLIGETYIIHQPSLVQHMEMRSRIDPRRSSRRQSRTFAEGKDRIWQR